MVGHVTRAFSTLFRVLGSKLELPSAADRRRPGQCAHEIILFTIDSVSDKVAAMRAGGTAAAVILRVIVLVCEPHTAYFVR